MACTEPDEVPEVEKLIGTDPTTKCDKTLANKAGALAHTDGVEVVMRTGAAGDEITLPLLKKISGSFPAVRVMNAAGEEMQIDANASCLPYALVSQNGSFTLIPLEQNSCWTDVCNKTPTQFAGFVVKADCEGTDQYCLTRFDGDVLAGFIVIQGSSCIQVTGTGSTTDPYVVSVKISEDEDNCLECRADGLYVSCSGILYGDPLP